MGTALGTTMDFIVLVILILAVAVGFAKGFVRSVYKIVALVGTIVLVLILQTPVVHMLSATPFAQSVYTSVNSVVVQRSDTAGVAGQQDIPPSFAQNALGNLGLPSVVRDNVAQGLQQVEGTVAQALDNISTQITMVILKIVACVGLFLVIRFLFAFVYRLLDAVSKLPVLGLVNRFGGGLLGLVNGFAIIYILGAVLALWMPVGGAGALQSAVEQSYLAKYFYHNNILLQLFMKA